MPDHDDTPDPFLHALQQSIRPEVLDRAARKLAEVVAAVAELEKKGRLTLTLDLSPMKNNTGAAEVAVRIKASIPEAMPASTFMWPDEHGRLHRNDPRQQELPGIRAIDHDDRKAN